MIDPAGLFLLGCWASIKAYDWITGRPDLLTRLTKDAESF